MVHLNIISYKSLWGCAHINSQTQTIINRILTPGRNNIWMKHAQRQTVLSSCGRWLKWGTSKHPTPESSAGVRSECYNWQQHYKHVTYGTTWQWPNITVWKDVRSFSPARCDSALNTHYLLLHIISVLLQYTKKYRVQRWLTPSSHYFTILTSKLVFFNKKSFIYQV